MTFERDAFCLAYFTDPVKRQAMVFNQKFIFSLDFFLNIDEQVFHDFLDRAAFDADEMVVRMIRPFRT